MSATEYDADGFNRPPAVYDANKRRGKLHEKMEGLLWRVRANLTIEYEYKTEKGKGGERSTPLGSDEKEAIRQWKILSGEAENGKTVIASGKHRFGDAWNAYHEDLGRWVAKGSVARKTIDNYESVYKHHLEAQWGEALLKGIEPDDIVDYFADKNEAGYSQAYQKQMQTVMSHCLTLAHGQKWILVNPLSLVHKLDLPKQQTRAEYEARLFRNDELAAMFLACNKLYTRMLIVLAYTGMRMGELCGLRWENVNLDERVIYVRGQLEIVRSDDAAPVYKQGPPKGKRTASHLQSRRDIDMLDGVVQALITQKENECEKGLGDPGDWVFTGSTGTGLPVIPANFRHRGVQDAAIAASLGHVRPHDFRHTTASILAAAGVRDEVAAQMMGHTVPMYRKTYAKAFRDAIERRETLAKLRGIGFGGSLKGAI